MPRFIFSVAVDEPKQIVIGQIKCGFNRECTKGDIEIFLDVCRRFLLVGSRDVLNREREQYRVGRVVRPRSCKTVVYIHKIATLGVVDSEC